MVSIDDRAVRQLVGQSCAFLDTEDFASFLSLCAPEFQYQVTVYSPEIKKRMVWMNHDRSGLSTLFHVLPQHVRLLGSLFRHASVYSIERIGSSNDASVVSSILIVQTDPDGVSKLFAAGRYLDTVRLSGDRPLLLARTVQLETRDVGIGSQAPL
jgi:methanesulfonate monooxygenase small subunit